MNWRPACFVAVGLGLAGLMAFAWTGARQVPGTMPVDVLRTTPGDNSPLGTGEIPQRATVDVLQPATADVSHPATVGTAALGFTPPAVGTYRLERIQQASDGDVLDSDGSTQRLRAFTTGKVTVFAFIYTYCTDAKGCPLAYATLVTLRQMIATDPTLANRVRFVSMSFDPDNDTPAMMRSYGGSDARATPSLSWHFLTAPSAAALAPILDGFGQDASVALPSASGERVPVLRHLLKVYLIDAGGTVREIYSPAFLHPVVLRNDIQTLLHEPAPPLLAGAARAAIGHQ